MVAVALQLIVNSCSQVYCHVTTVLYQGHDDVADVMKDEIWPDPLRWYREAEGSLGAGLDFDQQGDEFEGEDEYEDGEEPLGDGQAIGDEEVEIIGEHDGGELAPSTVTDWPCSSNDRWCNVSVCPLPAKSHIVTHTLLQECVICNFEHACRSLVDFCNQRYWVELLSPAGPDLHISCHRFATSFATESQHH
jgi:hypothetical protein